MGGMGAYSHLLIPKAETKIKCEMVLAETFAAERTAFEEQMTALRRQYKKVSSLVSACFIVWTLRTKVISAIVASIPPKTKCIYLVHGLF